MVASRARHQLLQSRLDRFTRLLHGVESGEARAIHQTRVATRRLRELLPVLPLGGHAAAKLGRRLRRAARRLGEVRELDVLLGVIDETRAGERGAVAILGQIAGEIRVARDKANGERVGKSLAVELHRIARKLEGAVDELQADEGPLSPKLQPASSRQRERAWRWAIDARVTRRAEALRDAITAAGALYIPERLHDVRIALKKFRYALEVSAEALGEDRRLELRRLKRDQDVLGRLHDLQVLIDRVRRAQTSLGAPDLASWRELDALLVSLNQSCRRLHARYVRNREPMLAVCARHLGKPAKNRHAGARRAG